MENGYENTSVRMILNEVSGQVGMFYHYFSSKEELFEEAVKLYFRQYAEQFGNIVSDASLSLPAQIEQIFKLFETTSGTYLSMNTDNNFHWTAELAFREKI